MKLFKIILGIIIAFSSLKVYFTDSLVHEQGAGLMGAITGLVLALGLSFWLIYSGAKNKSTKQQGDNNVEVLRNKVEPTLNSDRGFDSKTENLKSLRDSNILSESEYINKIDKINKEQLEEKVKKTSEFALLKNLYDSDILNKIEFEEKTKILFDRQSINNTLNTNSTIVSQSLKNPPKKNDIEKIRPSKQYKSNTDNSWRNAIIVIAIGIGLIIIIGNSGGFKKPDSGEESFPDINSIPTAVVDTSTATETTPSIADESSENSSQINETGDNQNIEMTVKTLEDVVDMSPSSFEDWASKNNYIYEKTKRLESCDAFYFKKGEANSLAYLVSNNGGNYGLVMFATTNISEYRNIINKCNEFGYRFSETQHSEDDASITSIYKTDNYELSFSVSNGNYLVHIGSLH